MTDTGPEGRSCPSCGKAASGNFCQHCGADLGGRFCNQCGARLAEDARFCNQCGAARSGERKAAPMTSGVADAPAPGRPGGTSRASSGAASGAVSGAASSFGGSPAGRSAGSAKPTGTLSGVRRAGGASKDQVTDSTAVGNLPWIVAGVSLFALILVVGFNMIQPGEPTGPTGQPGVPAAGTGVAPDISQMTPIEAADRLYNRVMSSMEVGDTAGAQAFLPMAVGAYQRAEPLNPDGVFHLSMLEMISEPAAALASAERILESEPNHVFGLALKGEAHRRLGQEAEARAAYQQLVDTYDAESARTLQEYTIHVQLLDAFRQEAEAYLAGG